MGKVANVCQNQLYQKEKEKFKKGKKKKKERPKLNTGSKVRHATTPSLCTLVVGCSRASLMAACRDPQRVAILTTSWAMMVSGATTTPRTTDGKLLNSFCLWLASEAATVALCPAQLRLSSRTRRNAHLHHRLSARPDPHQTFHKF